MPERITLEHIEGVCARLRGPLILWDNYPVNDLAMKDEMHLAPLTGRDARLPERCDGFLNNPLLQPEAAFVPLATCFDYAADPAGYDPEQSWSRAVRERYGAPGLEHWRTLREFCDALTAQFRQSGAATIPKRARLEAALRYFDRHNDLGAVRELEPWIAHMRAAASSPTGSR